MFEDDKGNWIKFSELVLEPRQKDYKKIIEFLEKNKDKEGAASVAGLNKIISMTVKEFNFFANISDLLFRIVYHQSKDLQDTQKTVTSTRDSILSLVSIIDRISDTDLKKVLGDISKRLEQSEQEIEKRKPFFESIETKIDEKVKETTQKDTPVDYDFFQ